MPNVNDIMQVAEALEKCPVVVVADRCVAVRNRNSTCRKCVHACIANAIEVVGNEVHLDGGACVGCGACAVVCPTEAIKSVAPSFVEVVRSAGEAASENGGNAVVACARISSKRLADPKLYAEVPCLAHVSEELLVQLIAHGAQDVLLVDGTCATCKYRGNVPAIDGAVMYGNELAAAQGSDVRIRRANAFPDEMLVENTAGLFGTTRRGFFSEAVGAAKDTAMTAARTTIANELGIVEKEQSIGDRLRVGSDGTMPRIDTPRHDMLLNAMDAIGAPVAEQVESRRFASVDVDISKCNACGMCAVFCPTGALVRDDDGGARSNVHYLEFSASGCVQCGLCEDVCWKGALKLSPIVSTEQLFDFEPRVFDLSTVSNKRKKLFG